MNFNLAVAAVKQIRGAMKDPDSFRLTSAFVVARDEPASGASCFEYRSRNSFNGYVMGQAVLDTHGKIWFDNSTKWNQVCAKNEGYEKKDEVNIAAGWQGLFSGEGH